MSCDACEHSSSELQVLNAESANVSLQPVGDLFPLGFRGRHPLDKSSNVVRKIIAVPLNEMAMCIIIRQAGRQAGRQADIRYTCSRT
jgi:hypothetical protein